MWGGGAAFPLCLARPPDLSLTIALRSHRLPPSLASLPPSLPPRSSRARGGAGTHLCYTPQFWGHLWERLAAELDLSNIAKPPVHHEEEEGAHAAVLNHRLP